MYVSFSSFVVFFLCELDVAFLDGVNFKFGALRLDKDLRLAVAGLGKEMNGVREKFGYLMQVVMLLGVEGVCLMCGWVCESFHILYL